MRQMSIAKRQAGMTMISWVLVFSIAAIIGVTIIRLFPVYMEHLGVTSSLDSLSQDHSLRGATPNELREALMRRMDINDVKRVSREDISIERDGNTYRVSVDYEVVTPFVHNVSFLVSFADTAEVVIR